MTPARKTRLVDRVVDGASRVGGVEWVGGVGEVVSDGGVDVGEGACPRDGEGIVVQVIVGEARDSVGAGDGGGEAEAEAGEGKDDGGAHVGQSVVARLCQESVDR